MTDASTISSSGRNDSPPKASPSYPMRCAKRRWGWQKSKQFMRPPRIKVALLPDDNGDIDNLSLFDIWIILHVPDDKNPEGIRESSDGGPYDRGDALQKLSEIWMEVGKKFAEVG